ncbi:MAG: DUF378 domain-containing protein [Phycisphaerae bacterium]|nr:DUF378 domain-containing protein [Phycisphaerae bacterium]
MKVIDVLAAVLLVIGGLNWGIWGIWSIFDADYVSTVLGGYDSAFAKVLFITVGVAAIYQALSVRAIQSRWKMASA